MGLFDKTSTTETFQDARSSVRVQGRSAAENQILEMLQGISSGAAGQFGDLSGLAAGELPELSEGMLAMLQSVADEMFSREERAATQTFEEGLAQASQQAAAQGQTGGSQEAMFRAIAGRERQRAVEDASSRSSEFLSRQRIALPQQQAAQMRDINALLFQMATQPAGMSLQTTLQERLANRDATSRSQSTSTAAEEGGLGSLVDLAGSLMSMGGLDIGQLFGTPSAGGGPTSQFTGPIGPGVSGSPLGTSPVLGPQGPAF